MIVQVATRLRRLVLGNRATILSMLVRVLGVVAGFAVTYLIAHRFGAEANGRYALVTQTGIFLSIIAVGGLDLAVVREFSRAVAEGRPLARKSMFAVLGIATALAALLCLILFLAGRPLMRLVRHEDFAVDALMVVAGLLVGRAWLRILAAVIRSQGGYSSSQGVEMLAPPVLTLVFMGMGGAGAGIDWLFGSAVAAGFVASAAGLVLACKSSSSSPDACAVVPRTLLTTSLPLWGVAISQNLVDWYGLATLSATSGHVETGVFRVAAQFSSVLPVVTLGLFGAFTAQVGAAAHTGQMSEVASVTRRATALSTLIIAPIAVLLFLGAPWILAVMGEEFIAGSGVLRALVLGQVFYVVTGMASQVLAMSGHPGVNFRINLVSTAFILLTAPLAAASWGGFGIALLIGASFVFKNLASLFAVWKLLGINAVTGSLRRVDG